MDKAMLTLKPDAALTEGGNQVGLTLDGRTQYAKNPHQAEMIRALLRHPLSPERVVELLREGNDSRNDNEISLAIAEFILDFGEYLNA